MITLEWPLMLALLPLPLVVRLLLPRARVGRAGAVRLPFFRELAGSGLVAGGRPRGRGMRLAVLVLIWLLLVLAAARPVHHGTPVPVASEAREMMLALDLSGSMGREDLRRSGAPATRLKVVQQALDSFLAGRTGDRVGLVLFGDRPFTQAPLTLDIKVVRDLLSEAIVGMLGGSAAVGDGIGLAVKTMRDHPATDRVLVLLVDGTSGSGALPPMLAAELARSEHVKIHTVGIGSGDPMPMPPAAANGPPELDEETLSAVAALTGGRYFRAHDETELRSVLATIGRLEPAAGAPRFLRPTTALFYLPLGVALLLSMILAGMLLRPARVRRPAAAEAVPAGGEP